MILQRFQDQIWCLLGIFCVMAFSIVQIITWIIDTQIEALVRETQIMKEEMSLPRHGFALRAPTKVTSHTHLLEQIL